MADGQEIRAQIDTETVRGLQLINGGTAAALTTLAAPIIQNPAVHPLAVALILSIGASAFGLVCATIHNRLRRKCSLQYSFKPENRQPQIAHAFRALQTVEGEPRVCTVSVMWMYSSLVCFCVAAGSMVIGGAMTLGREAPKTAACWKLEQVSGATYRFNMCTGVLDSSAPLNDLRDDVRYPPKAPRENAAPSSTSTKGQAAPR